MIKNEQEAEMLKESSFNLLCTIDQLGNQYITQRKLAEKLGISLGKVNAIITSLKAENLLNDQVEITEKGYDILSHYKVDNAVIMAAGMSTRFAPLSYEKPKGLLEVKGEKLIERQIKQLKAVGIDDITIVVGYMKEKMFYLGEKYNVDIVINADYHRYNNSSSLKLVTHKLKNTYICSSDNYFTENPFEKYVYTGYYSCVYQEGKTQEYCVKFDNKNIIKDVTIGSSDSWIMLGHVYFDKTFSTKFVEILNQEFENQITKEQLWEDLYIRYIKDLSLRIRKYDTNVIKEFDSLEDLRLFDDKYMSNADSSIFTNICKILNCKQSDIVDILPIKAGLTNTSFKFSCFGKHYVYRHPGLGTESYINRQSEAASMEIAKKLGLDKTLIHIDKNTGWKLSYFIDDAKILDYNNLADVKKAIGMLKKLHTSGEKTDFEFNIWNEIDKIKKNLANSYRTDFENMDAMELMIAKIKENLSQSSQEKCLCHSDAYEPNFLIDKTGQMYLIDWEYSGMSDYASDLATFIACSNYSIEEANQIIDIYFGRPASQRELKHCYGYISTVSFYWFLWALNQENNGKVIGEFLYLWYQYCNKYGKLSLEM